MKYSMPGFCSPTLLSMPELHSATRGDSLPNLGLSVSPFDEIPPIEDKSNIFSISRPNPNVPEAAIIGLFKIRLPILIFISTIQPPPRRRPVLQHSSDYAQYFH